MAWSQTTSGGYLLGSDDPYRQLRGGIKKDIKATPLDPRKSPLYNEYAGKLQEQVATDYASRGLGNSGLGVRAGAEAESGLYANLWNQARQQRLGYYNALSGIPYLRDYSMSAMGGGGGIGPGSVTMDFSRVDADRANRLAQQQLKMQAGQNAYLRANMGAQSMQPVATSSGASSSGGGSGSGGFY